VPADAGTQFESNNMMSKKFPVLHPGPVRKFRFLFGIAALSVLFAAASSPAATYRYYRFNTTATLAGGNLVQLSEFKLLSGGTRVVPDLSPSGTGAVYNESGAGSPDGETPPNLIDNNNSKWLHFGGSGVSRAVIFDFGTGTLPDIDSYTFVTAQGGATLDGENGRNPTSWTMEGSNDAITWDLLDLRTNHPTPLPQYTEVTPAFTFPTAIPPVISSFASSEVVVVNGSSVDLSWTTEFTDTVTLSPGGSPGLPLNHTLAVTPPFTAGQVTDSAYTLEADSNTSEPVSRQLNVRTVPGGSVSGSYVRFTPVETGGTAIQLADIRFYQTSGGDRIEATPFPISCTYTDGSGGTGGESPNQMIDASPFTKWYNGTLRPVVFTFPEAVTFDSYAFTLGGDAGQYPDRNPRKWTMEISDDGVNWDLIEDFTSFQYPMPAVDNAVVTLPLPGYRITAPPEILSFRASRATWLENDPILFSWDVTGAESITITPGTGEELPAFGTLEYLPTADATYTLTATNGGGTVTRTLSFDLVAPPTGTIAYTDFSSAGDEIVLLGDAALTNDFPQIPQPGDAARLRLTPDEAGRLGVAWYDQRIALSGGFDTTFQLQLSCDHRGYGAEGLGFMVQNTAEGLAALPQDNGPAADAFTVKFSTWDNAAVFPETLNEARINLFAGATRIHTVNLRDFPAINLRGTDFATLTGPYDAAPYLVRIAYVPGDLDVWVDNVQVITDFNLDLGAINAVDSAGTAYVGFVARTGGWEQASDIASWSLTASGAPAAPLALLSSSIDPVAGNAAFTWASTPGTQYRITSSTDLLDWSTIVEQDIDATGTTTEESITFPPGATKMFFRIEEQD
jgi:hypothetical protein